MITRIIHFFSFTLLTLSIFSQSPKVEVELLKGDQPRFLKSFASSPSARETLNGTGLNVGAIIGGWHAQAVAQYKDYIYVAFSTGDKTGGKIPSSKTSSLASKLWIYNTKTKQGKIKELEKGYAHPCSIQITGKYLTIAIEAEYGLSQAALGTKRESKSMALIFDLEKDPYCSIEAARVVQDSVNSGGAGLTYSDQMKCWYLLMDQDAENGRVVIYKTKDQNINSWIKEPIAKYNRFGSGAGLNLITASDNSIWGLYYDVTENLPNLSKWEISGDEIYLFKLVEPNGTPVAQRVIYSQVVEIGAPRIKQAGELLANRPGMRFGASLRNENGKLEILTCQRNMDDKFFISRTPLVLKDQTKVAFVNFARTKGEIKCSSISNKAQSFSSQNLQMESWNKILDTPVKCDINYLPVSASSIKSLSVPKWKDVAEYESNAPLTLIYLEGTNKITGQMREFYPAKKSDKMLK
ncbi:hypothetical protein [Ekhidna sp.]|uniref:hypothetical protein n=1 Tax=Ekhidna sp. TaxID=2608089 RepID=UPI003C7A44B6